MSWRLYWRWHGERREGLRYTPCLKSQWKPSLAPSILPPESLFCSSNPLLFWSLFYFTQRYLNSFSVANFFQGCWEIVNYKISSMQIYILTWVHKVYCLFSKCLLSDFQQIFHTLSKREARVYISTPLSAVMTRCRSSLPHYYSQDFDTPEVDWTR